MKWWGWGRDDVEFAMGDHPELWPFVAARLGIETDAVLTPPVTLDRIELAPPKLDRGFCEACGVAVHSEKVERVAHAYGKSYRDLWRVRHGIVDAAPDGVVYPKSEAEVCGLVEAAAGSGVVLIPFGGGSNIAGCLEARAQDERMVVSLDMKLLDRVLDVDRESGVARIQAGAMGPALEQQLRQRGVTLGHFPDSFEHSSLGGWIATRSAGMQSDKYGKIEDMVLSLRMVTPRGVIVTRTVPKSSNGIDVNHVCIGSEGTLGVITEAAMQVHDLPERKEWYGYLFPDFESGVAALHACVKRECAPAVSRLNDPNRTQLSLAYREKAPPSLVRSLVKSYLKRRFDLTKCCLLIIAVEGDRGRFRTLRKGAHAVYKAFGGFCLGTGPGRAFERGKYDFPYLRDWVMDRNVMADVSETSTVWSNVLPLYHATLGAIEDAIASSGSRPFAGCHISHTYHSGASLYFTFACRHRAERPLAQYLRVKKAAEDAFLRGGATLSHHHAVGYEHLPWVEQDISAAGVVAVRALKSGLDPRGVMNPGKIIPPEDPLAGWGLGE